MMRGIPFQDGLQAVAALVALSLSAPVPAVAAEVACRPSHEFVVEVDGEYPGDALFYETDTNGKFLVDIPSKSKSVLIDLPAGRAVSVPRASLRTETIDGTIRVAEPGSETPASRLAIEGAVVSFQIGASKVRVLKSGQRPPVAETTSGPAGKKAAAADSASARSCLRIEPHPVSGVPGCGKFVDLKNACEDYVLAQISRTEHLFSGTLPQTFSVVVPPGGDHSLGCAWWSGAMAPTQHEILAASFLDGPARSAAKGRHGPDRP